LLFVAVLLFTGPVKVTVNLGDDRGQWQGWGCSLCWWANAVGSTEYRDLYADVVFSTRTRHVLAYDLPGLGLSIARYNVGGGGNGDLGEMPSPKTPWFRKIQGYWLNPADRDPKSSGWDWTRDAGQRAMMDAAHRRGAQIEFFSNAPMWWMTQEHSSDGGALLESSRQDYAYYLAAVVDESNHRWHIPVTSVEPFNEPSARWWRYPGTQEGVHVPPATQAEMLGSLRAELDTRKLSNVPITASDENTFGEAITAYETLRKSPLQDGKTAADLVSKVNVHAYYGTNANRDIKSRQTLRGLVGAKPLWMSEFGDPDGGGTTLARCILQDVNYLRASAWIYWQPIEAGSGWGFLNAKFGRPEDEHAPDRAAPTWVYYKYFAFAQFTRFIRPGFKILGTDSDDTMAAYDQKSHRLVFVYFNEGPANSVTFDARGFRRVASSVHATETNCEGPKLLSAVDAASNGSTATVQVDAKSIVSVVFDNVE
jgi:O-Glycosyl hydrolase family 30